MKKILSINEVKFEAQKVISEIQTEADKTAYQYLKAKEDFEEAKKLITANYFLNFDLIAWWSILLPIITDFEVLDFIIKNNSELKRKMTFKEFVNFSAGLRLLKTYNQNPSTFNEFKEMYSKIKLTEK